MKTNLLISLIVLCIGTLLLINISSSQAEENTIETFKLNYSTFSKQEKAELLSHIMNSHMDSVEVGISIEMYDAINEARKKTGWSERNNIIGFKLMMSKNPKSTSTQQINDIKVKTVFSKTDIRSVNIGNAQMTRGISSSTARGAGNAFDPCPAWCDQYFRAY